MSWPRGVPRKKKESKVESEPVPQEKVKHEHENVLRRAIVEDKPKERQFSNYEDHEGPGHPLCLTCGHRQDRHCTWKTVTYIRQVKNAYGTMVDKEETVKEKVFDNGTPCQHACKCTEYQ